MSNTLPMSLDDIQRAAHALFSNGTDVPASDDDEYILRTTFLNHFVRDWEGVDGVDWDQLYDLRSSDVFGANGTAVACPSSFGDLAGKVLLTKAPGEQYAVPVRSIKRLEDVDLPTSYCWISGRPGAFELNFFGVPDEWISSTIRYRFRRWATELVDSTDIPDMTHPNYLVKMLAARLFFLSRNNTQFQVNFNDAQDDMSAMITENTQLEESEEPPAMGSRISGGITGS